MNVVLKKRVANVQRRRNRSVLIVTVVALSACCANAYGAPGPAAPDGLSATVIALAKLGAVGLAAIGMFLGFYLLNNGKKANAYLAMSSLFFLAALGVEIAEYFIQNKVFFVISPSTFPNDLPRPLLMNNETEMTLTNGKGFFTCQPNHTVSFDVQNIVDKYHDAQRHLSSAIAVSVGTPESDFGPDVAAGAAK